MGADPKTYRGPTPPEKLVRRGQEKKEGNRQESERAHLPHLGGGGCPRIRRRCYLIIYLTHHQGEVQLAANPQHNTVGRHAPPGGPGEGGAGIGVTAEEGGGRGRDTGRKNSRTPLEERRLSKRRQSVEWRRGRQRRKRIKREEMDKERPHGGNWRGDPRGGDFPSPEENADLPDFTPEHAHLLLRGFYGDYPIITMGRTWMEELRTTLYGSVVCAG